MAENSAESAENAAAIDGSRTMQEVEREHRETSFLAPDSALPEPNCRPPSAAVSGELTACRCAGCQNQFRPFPMAPTDLAVCTIVHSDCTRLPQNSRRGVSGLDPQIGPLRERATGIDSLVIP